MTQTISSKDLRLKFPWVQEQLLQGVQFIVICRSKPVGILGPFLENTLSASPEASDDDLLRSQVADMEKGLAPLTQEETKHYLSLPDLSLSA